MVLFSYFFLATYSNHTSPGRMMSGEIKAELINCLVPLVEGHQARKKEVTDEMVEKFMEVRKLTY